MQTSVAVFLAFVAIYLGSIVLPFEFAYKSVAWTAQAASVSGAVATFMLMRTHSLGVAQGAAVLSALTLITTLAGMAVLACTQRQHCQNQWVPAHTLVFSSGFTMGAAAYIGSLAGAQLGLPPWASIVVSVLSAPVFMTYIMPFVLRWFEALFVRVE